MFYGIIYQGRKKLAVFWEKNLKNINSLKYNQFILSDIQTLIGADFKLMFIQNNLLFYWF